MHLCNEAKPATANSYGWTQTCTHTHVSLAASQKLRYWGGRETVGKDRHSGISDALPLAGEIVCDIQTFAVQSYVLTIRVHGGEV